MAPLVLKFSDFALGRNTPTGAIRFLRSQRLCASKTDGFQKPEPG
jgi:hypothetical protein